MRRNTRGVVSMNIAVIGGAGRMGRWLVRYFSSRGHKVIISDIKMNEARTLAKEAGVEFAENNIEAAKTGDLIIVSTPIQVTPKVIHKIVPYLRKGAIVAEISSLKTHLVKDLTQIAKSNVRPLSIHPLFGPGTRKITRRKIAVIPILNAEAEKKIAKELFPEAEIIVIDAEKHDKAMALTLSLPHFMNIVFAAIISEEDLKNLKKLEGPTFKLQLTLAESIMTEDSALQASIQFNNEYAFHYLNKFLAKAKILEKWIANKEEEKFNTFCNNVQNLLSKDVDFTKSYENMYRILERS